MAGQSFDLDPSIKVLVHDLGVSPAQVLRRAALPRDLFARRPPELSVAEYYRFWDAIAAEADDADRDDFAVTMCEAISVEHFSPPIFAALCSPDLRTAAQRLAVYKPLIGPIQLDIDTAAGVTITYRWPSGPPPPLLLATVELMFWVALARITTREQVRPTRVTMPAPPQDRGSLEHYLGCRVRKGLDYSVAFAAADATRPFLTENDQMWQVFAPGLRRRLADLNATATTAERVRAALIETLPAGDPSMTAVTGQLATSARTLQRQLSQEGTSFQAVLASTREGLARHYLTRDDLRTSEIAFLLGYNDTNSFYRAFKTWTGVTPEMARANGRS
ncbi:AraC family transcriptional regulator [Mycolicibacterium porcinum]|uniref:AraC family transcriptional regulator ligand-binding domain-containing protein n=1 Tax=Mycolicibacterium porcinum TaxID=39693 RepID=A0AAW5T834_9MYCO|nr:AraC family transcriptional regulator [Mycolicibacterium porcinum]MCV7390433.1 AraC family transcriptional regulator ligand-binding domain-containing protein [Mycolicibacterium porcinum]ORB36184.1 AraC family transcriptional regulator [Mycolicibacterium porcinum]CDO31023.1 AraC family transcriptional regulator [Mycolicibacterium vulneris]